MILRRFKTGTRGSSRSWPVEGQGGAVERELYTKTTYVKTQRHLIYKCFFGSFQPNTCVLRQRKMQSFA